MNKKLFIAAIAIMTFSALAVTAFQAIAPSANDPLQLIEYTPEEKAQLLQNSSEWKRLQIEIENAQMIQKQLNEDSKRIQQGVDSRLSTLIPVAQAASITPPVNEHKSQPSVDTVDQSDIERKVNELWKGYPIENLAHVLVEDCQRSTQVNWCIASITAQTKLETKFGTDGVGRSHHKNLTGIRDKINGVWVWRTYLTYEDSIHDTTKVFIDGDYQSYYTLYGDDGLCKHLERWGTNQCGLAKEIINNLNS